jgi:predicted Zn finger-like uncharacterized protein
MNVTCPECTTVYRVDPRKIPAGGVRARCARCPAEFPVAELVEVGAVYAETFETTSSGVEVGGAAAESSDPFADSFIGIEIADGETAAEVVPDVSGGSGTERDFDGGTIDEGDRGYSTSEIPSAESWSEGGGSTDSTESGDPATYPELPADLDGMEQETSGWHSVESAEPYATGGWELEGSAEGLETGESPAADDTADAPTAGGVAHAIDVESSDDGREAQQEDVGYAADVAHGYDRNGFRYDSVSAPPPTPDHGWASSSEARVDDDASDAQARDDGYDADALESPEAQDAGHDGDTGYSEGAAAAHAEASEAVDASGVDQAAAGSHDAEWGHGGVPTYPSASEVSAVPPVETAHAWNQPAETEQPPAAPLAPAATPSFGPRPVQPEPEPAPVNAFAAEAPRAAEMLESIQTPEGFSEVERRLPDADAQLPPAPFGSADPHSRAKRLARALVSDIVVYHPDRRERSIRAGTVRQEFRDEIRKSWDEYVSHVGNQMARETPYFRDALNELLAGGNELF